MREPVEPALTSEEWVKVLAHQARNPKFMPYFDAEVAPTMDYQDVHQVAALALHGREFGFTRADIAAIRAIEAGDDSLLVMQRLDWLVTRIDALLPPETP